MWKNVFFKYYFVIFFLYKCMKESIFLMFISFVMLNINEHACLCLLFALFD